MHFWAESYIAFDTETTGLNARARIIELGVVRFEMGVPVAEWSSLLWPTDVDWDSSDVQGALAVNGLRREDLVGKPTFQEAYDQICVALSSKVWVAHNAEFDKRMLRQELSLFNSTQLLDVPDHVLCTKKLAAQFAPRLENHKLESVARRWQIPQQDAHRAVVDARVCGLVFAEMFGDGWLPLEEEELRRLTQRTARRFYS
jgi:DNA polymerase III subunit epsilon